MFKLEPAMFWLYQNAGFIHADAFIKKKSEKEKEGL